MGQNSRRTILTAWVDLFIKTIQIFTKKKIEIALIGSAKVN